MPTSFWTQVSQWLEMPSASLGLKSDHPCWKCWKCWKVLMKSEEIHIFNSLDLSCHSCCHTVDVASVRPHSSHSSHSSRALMQAWERDPHGSDSTAMSMWKCGTYTTYTAAILSSCFRWFFQISWPPMHLWRCWCLTDWRTMFKIEPMVTNNIGKAFRHKSRIQEICQFRCVLTLHNLHNLSQKEQAEWNPNKARWPFSAKMCKVSIHNFFIPRSSTLMPASHSSLLTSHENRISVVLDESLCDAVGQNAFGYRERQPLFWSQGCRYAERSPHAQNAAGLLAQSPTKMKQKEGVAQGRNGVAMVALVWHQSAQVSHIISQLLAISGGMIRRVSKILKTDCRKLSLFWCLLLPLLIFIVSFSFSADCKGLLPVF